jgi:alpha-D-ribose 1-methylphosphonate 5-phosphate C-P lyase
MTMHDANAPHQGDEPVDGYNFAYLDEQTKRMIRRSLLKAVAVPGYQVPFGSREMPLPYGWGTGGIQVTAAIIGRADTLKVIDQGSDQTTNAVNIRRFFARTTGVPVTTRTTEATIVQTRHRIPETPLTDKQILVYQVPMPEPLYRLEPRVAECRKLHALSEYGLISVKLYEDIVRHGSIATTYDYPIMVNDRYLASPSPIPKFDNPKMHMNPALQLFGAGRERRLYAIPPYTRVRSLDFDDHPFEIERWDHACALCGSRDSYLDEMIVDNDGRRMFVCSDSDYCQEQVAAQDRARVAEADRYIAGRSGDYAGGHAGERPGRPAPATRSATVGHLREAGDAPGEHAA